MNSLTLKGTVLDSRSDHLLTVSNMDREDISGKLGLGMVDDDPEIAEYLK